MNTRMSYHYADKTNCLQYTSIVIAGTLTWEQIAPYLANQHSFIPGQLGLEDLQYRFAQPGADHPWHQIAPEDLRPTDAAPTVELSAEELAQRFARMPWKVDWTLPGAAMMASILEPAPSVDTPPPTNTRHNSAPTREASPRSRKTSTRTR